MKRYILNRPCDDSFSMLLRSLQGQKATDVLAGMCLGILADGEINSKEALFLEKWIRKNGEFLPSFVKTKLLPVLRKIHFEEEATPQSLSDLTNALEQMVGINNAESEAEPNSLITTAGLPSKLIFDVPQKPLDLLGIEIVVTGQFKEMKKLDVIKLLKNRGVHACNRLPSTFTRYVFVGCKGSKDWAFSNFGRKIERALELKEAGHDIMIYPETVIVEYLKNTLDIDPSSDNHLPHPAQADTSDKPYAGKTVVITGTLSISRDDMKA